MSKTRKLIVALLVLFMVVSPWMNFTNAGINPGEFPGTNTELDGDCECLLFLCFQINNENAYVTYAEEEFYNTINNGDIFDEDGMIIGNTTLHTAPIISNSRTCAGIRDITDNIPGSEVFWDGTERRVDANIPTTIYADGTTPTDFHELQIWIGKATAKVNGQPKFIDDTQPSFSAFIDSNNRAQFPVRFISESSGAVEVIWLSDTKTAIFVFDVEGCGGDNCGQTGFGWTPIGEYSLGEIDSKSGLRSVNFTSCADGKTLQLFVDSDDPPHEFAEWKSGFARFGYNRENGLIIDTDFYPEYKQCPPVIPPPQQKCYWTLIGLFTHDPNNLSTVLFDENCDGTYDESFSYTNGNLQPLNYLLQDPPSKPFYLSNIKKGCAKFCVTPFTNKIISWEYYPNMILCCDPGSYECCDNWNISFLSTQINGEDTGGLFNVDGATDNWVGASPDNSPYIGGVAAGQPNDINVTRSNSVSEASGRFDRCLVLDSKGNPHVAWGVVDDIHYVYWGLDPNDSNSIYTWRCANGDVYNPASSPGNPGCANVSNNLKSSYDVSLALDGNDFPHLAWENHIGSNIQLIFYVRWNPGLDSWVCADGMTTYDPESTNAGIKKFNGHHPSLALNGDKPHIAWTSSRIYYAYWDNGWKGADTNPLTSVNGKVSATHGKYPSLALDDNKKPHIAWGNGDEIYYVFLSGITWMCDTTTPYTSSASANVSDNTGYSRFPSLALEGKRPHIAWQDDHTIYYVKHNGNDWVCANGEDYNSGSGNASIESIFTGSSREPSLALDGDTPHIAWGKEVNGYYEILYAHYDNNTDKWLCADGSVYNPNSANVSRNSGFSQYVTLALDGAKPHLVWTDSTEGNNEVFYVHLDENECATTGDLINFEVEITNNCNPPMCVNIINSPDIAGLVLSELPSGNPISQPLTIDDSVTLYGNFTMPNCTVNELIDIFTVTQVQCSPPHYPIGGGDDCCDKVVSVECCCEPLCVCIARITTPPNRSSNLEVQIDYLPNCIPCPPPELDMTDPASVQEYYSVVNTVVVPQSLVDDIYGWSFYEYQVQGSGSNGGSDNDTCWCTDFWFDTDGNLVSWEAHPERDPCCNGGCDSNDECEWVCGCVKKVHQMTDNWFFYPDCDYGTADYSSFPVDDYPALPSSDGQYESIDSWINETANDDGYACVEFCIDDDGALVAWNPIQNCEAPCCCCSDECSDDWEFSIISPQIDEQNVDNLFNYCSVEVEQCINPGDEVRFKPIITNNTNSPIYINIESCIDGFTVTDSLNPPIQAIPQPIFVPASGGAYLYGLFTMPDCVAGGLLTVFKVTQVDSNGQPVSDSNTICVTVECCEPCCDIVLGMRTKILHIVCTGSSFTFTDSFINNCGEDIEVAFSYGSGSGVNFTTPATATIPVNGSISVDINVTMPDECFEGAGDFEYTVTPLGCDPFNVGFHLVCDDQLCCGDITTTPPSGFQIIPYVNCDHTTSTVTLYNTGLLDIVITGVSSYGTAYGNNNGDFVITTVFPIPIPAVTGGVPGSNTISVTYCMPESFSGAIQYDYSLELKYCNTPIELSFKAARFCFGGCNCAGSQPCPFSLPPSPYIQSLFSPQVLASMTAPDNCQFVKGDFSSGEKGEIASNLSNYTDDNVTFEFRPSNNTERSDSKIYGACSFKPSEMKLSPNESKNFEVIIEMPECKEGDKIFFNYQVKINDYDWQDGCFYVITSKPELCCDVTVELASELPAEVEAGEKVEVEIGFTNNCNNNITVGVFSLIVPKMTVVKNRSFHLKPGETKIATCIAEMPKKFNKSHTSSTFPPSYRLDDDCEKKEFEFTLYFPKKGRGYLSSIPLATSIRNTILSVVRALKNRTFSLLKE